MVLVTLGHAQDDTLPGVRRTYVDDPFGNRIELVATDRSDGADRRTD